MVIDEDLIRYYHAARMKWNALERKRGELEDQLIDDLARWSTWSYATGPYAPAVLITLAQILGFCF